MRKGLAISGVALALGCFAGSAVASTISWSAAALIDQRLPFAVPEGITDVSCPSIHLCVGTQASGVEISRSPLGGAGSWAITQLPVTPGGPLDTISCASPRLCVAASDAGQVFTSTDPTGGAAAWKRTSVGVLFYPAVSCPRVRFCIVLNGRKVLVSTQPTRPHSWRAIDVSSAGTLSSIACPSSKLCVGTMPTAGYGGITWTKSPTGPARDWKVIDRSYDFGAGSIACPSAHLCVAIDLPWPGGDVFTSTNPARGRWRIGYLGTSDLRSVSCPSVHLCVAVGSSTVAVSSNPAGGAGTWRISTLPASNLGMGALTCASVHLCLATNGDLVSTTADPARGAAAWSSSYLDQGYNPIAAIACPSEQVCVGIDGGGNLITSSAPSAIPTAWNVAPLAIGSQSSLTASLSCPSASWCAAATSSGLLITSDPSNAGAWSSTPLGLNDVSCPTATFCVGSDWVGAVHISGNPSGGATAWSSQQVGAAPQCERQYCYYDPLTAVSCPSANLCATTDGKYLWTSADPSAGDAVWAKSPLPGSASKLHCPTESLCLAASNATLEATSDPADPSPQWTAMNLPKVVIPATFGPAVASISGLSCVSAQLCVAVDQAGGYAFVGNPSDPNSWTATKIDYSSPGLTGVSCNPGGACVAVDGTGHILVGTASG